MSESPKDRAVAQPEARGSHVPEAAGSSPVGATSTKRVESEAEALRRRKYEAMTRARRRLERKLASDPKALERYGRNLAARTLAMASFLISETRRAHDVRANLASAEMSYGMNPHRVAKHELSPADLAALARDLQDRFGTPRRSSQAIEVRDTTPIRFVERDGIEWPERAEDRADVVAGNGAGNGRIK